MTKKHNRAKPKTEHGHREKMKQSTAIKMLSSASAVALILVFILVILNIQANNRLTAFTQASSDASGFVGDFVDASSYLTQEVRSYVVTGDQIHYDNYYREVETDQNRERAVQGLKALGISEEENSLIDRIQTLSNGLVPLEEQAMRMTQKGVNEDAINLVYSGSYENTVSEIHNLQDKLAEATEKRVETERSRLNFWINIFLYITFAMLAVVVAVQIIIIRYVTRNILRPLILIEKDMEEMALGNLDHKLALAEDKTEVGKAVAAINRSKQKTNTIVRDIDYVMGELSAGNMTVRLAHTEHYTGAYTDILTSMRKLKEAQSSTLQQIGAVSDQVAMESGQVAGGAQALAQGATEQASAVEELSATISDISTTAQANADNSSLALKHSQQAATFVAASAENIRKMVTAMGDISRSSQEIGKIIATIENIAFQTNILALNVAVEAARAGVAGKGFAVVADEVRNLASKSDEAAKATKELIHSSVESVKRGEMIVEQVSQALESTIEAAQKAEADIAQITSAIREETESISQVAEGIEQISTVIQTNSATSEESAAASEELSSQAARLKELVSRFKI